MAFRIRNSTYVICKIYDCLCIRHYFLFQSALQSKHCSLLLNIRMQSYVHGIQYFEYIFQTKSGNGPSKLQKWNFYSPEIAREIYALSNSDMSDINALWLNVMICLCSLLRCIPLALRRPLRTPSWCDQWPKISHSMKNGENGREIRNKSFRSWGGERFE